MIPIYKIEKADENISKNISKASFGMECQLLPSVPNGKKIQDILFSQTVAKLYPSYGNDQFDLFPVYSLLVSTGWNKNTDVFKKNELWGAVASPIHKPFNVEHIPNKIIGHMVSSCLVDDEYNPIDMSLSQDELPDQLHILNTSVIYRHIQCRDPEWEKQVATWIDEINNGDWHVSMEVLFKNFDYALMNSSGKEEVITRSEDTAYLTKYLVFYGGSGRYEDKKIGRVLRNITFSGQGLVRKPANPDSIISTDPGVFNNMFASINIKESDKDMSQEQITKLETELAEVKAKLVETEGQLNTAKASETELVMVKTELQTIKDSVIIKDTAIAELNVKVTELTTKATELEAIKTDIDSKLAKSEEELSAMKAQALKDSRITALRGAADFTDEELTSFLDQYMSLNDEQFTTVIKTLAAKCKKDDEKKKGMATEEKPVEEDKSGEAAAAATNLENAEVENDPKLANDGVNTEQIQQAKAHLSGFLKNLIDSGKK
jgi:hypothetical protein